MSDANDKNAPLSDEELEELVAASDSGARNPAGPVGKMIAGVALFWAAFQLWIASPLPYTVIGRVIPVLNDTQTRSLHLAIAIFLAFMPTRHLKAVRVRAYQSTIGC